ncbi:hypothetical protein OROGR_030411 [Orobanche gracilis]
MERFIDEKISASLDMLSRMDDLDIVRVMEVIEGLGSYFKQSTEKLMKESPAYSEYDRAIQFFKEGDEESALYHVHLAGKHLLNAKAKNEYQVVGYDYLVFLLLGLFETADSFLSELDEYVVLSEKLNKLRKLCKYKINQFLMVKESCENGSVVDLWIMSMLAYWFFVTKKPGRVKNDDDLKKYKTRYTQLLQKEDGSQYLKKAIISEILRYEFCSLLLLIQDRTMKTNRRKLVICGVKGNIAGRDMRQKLICLDTYVRGVEVTEDNECGCYGFLILLICGVCYQLIGGYSDAVPSFGRAGDYGAAVKSFERARVVLDRLKDPFKVFFDQIDFGKFEAHCKTKCPSISSSLSDLVIEDTKDDVKIKKNEALINKNPSDLSVLKGKLNKTQITEDEAVIKGKPEDESNDEAKDKVHSRCGWIIGDWVEYEFESDYSYAGVTRQVFDGVNGVGRGDWSEGEIEEEKGTMIRGVIRGLWVLSSLDYSCLGFNGNGIFVCNSWGKIKPCVESDDFKMWKRCNGNVRDIRDLRKILYTIIVYPFRSNVDAKIDVVVKAGHASEPTSYSLDLEMRLFFELTQENFLLVSGENIMFEREEDRVVHAIFHRENSERYTTEFDVVRYAVNVIKHYNGKEYDSIRPRILKDVEIELILRDRLPDLYCALVRSVFMGLRCSIIGQDDSEVCQNELLSRW